MEGKFDYDDNPSWRIFRIMAEFVDGFSFLARLQKSVTFFGSARFLPDTPSYRLATDVARVLGEGGYTVITGGGPGIMEAANAGAFEAGAESVGLNIQLALEQRANPYLTRGMGFHYFFTRKVMLAFAAQAYIFFPGGFGTLDELFEILTLIQTKKIHHPGPVILVGREYWQPLLDWIKKTVYDEYKAIDGHDQDLWTLTDSPEEVLQIVQATTMVPNKDRFEQTPGKFHHNEHR